MWFLRIAEAQVVGLNSPGEDSSIVLSPHIPDCVNLLRLLYYLPTFQTVSICREFFLRLKAICLRPELSRGTTVATELGQAVLELKLEVNQCNGMGSNSLSDDFKVNALPL